MNKAILIGRLTKELELKYTPNGVAFCSFGIAVNREVANANGEREADFINCVAFKGQAENLCKYMSKGSLIAIEGKIQTRRYLAQDGTNRTATEILCDKIAFLEVKKKEQTQVNTQPVSNNFDFDIPEPKFSLSDEDLPF